MRRIAVKHLLVGQKDLGQMVVELHDNRVGEALRANCTEGNLDGYRVGNLYPLVQELPNTEWHSGTFELLKDNTLMVIR